MKPVFVIFLFLVSLLSARAAELTCLCFEDTVTHESGINSSIASDHHSESSDSEEHKDHCQHTCSQCHFAALVPIRLYLSTPDSEIYLPNQLKES